MTKTEMEALFADKEFNDKIMNAKDNAEIVKIFAENGIEVTEKDIEEAKAIDDSDDELDVETLDNVVGGVIKGPIYWLGYLFGKLFTKGVCS